MSKEDQIWTTTQHSSIYPCIKGADPLSLYNVCKGLEIDETDETRIVRFHCSAFHTGKGQVLKIMSVNEIQ